ncbi:Harbinger transposase-derived nuclease [Macleaya cordata]|uniref:Harbinger transposase-derived nuclease n=1 Tax=Macleaya cordata TaxID=56857 RepID=A0A200PML6_MACCD|nr:Harbinger transposase-derived nuclease [Macleaya cordata]
MECDGEKSTTTSSPAKKRTRGPKKGPQNHHNHLFPLIPLVSSATSAAHSFLSQNDLHLHPSQTLILESKITSVVFSLTKLNSLLQTLNHSNTKTLTLPLPLPPPPSFSSSSSSSTTTFSPSSPCWFQRFVSSASDQSDPRWVESFRMSKPSFILLLQTLTPSLQNSSSKIPPDYMLGTALFRLAHGTSFKSVGRRFGIDSSGACRAFYEVCKAVNDRLGHLFELSSNDLSRIIVGFGWISLPNCCGVLGFSKFLIESEKKDDDSAVIVQCLVDSEGRFLDVSAGWPGKMNPPTILRHTKLFSRGEHPKEFLNGPSFEFRDGNSIPQYVLGDSYCPLLPWLLTPYPISSKDDDNSNNSSVQAFNSVHNRGMKLVGTAFGRLRARWKLLSMKWKEESIESYPFVIVAGCLLHNFLLKCSEPLPDENEDYSLEQDEFPVFEDKGNEEAQRIRDTLALQLAMVSQRV